MTVEITMHNGNVLTPSFDPEHKKAIIAFYSEQFEKGLIQAWRLV